MTGSDLSERYQSAHTALNPVGQAHLLNFYDRLKKKDRARLLDQIEGYDWPRLAELVETHVKQPPALELPERIEPAPFYPAQPTPDMAAQYGEARELGERLIRDGRVAAFTVAGGQGTRLGWNGPKGTYPATPITHKPLFQVFAEHLRKVEAKYGRAVPWYIMTSPVNDEATRYFFDMQGYFGLDPANITFFPQGTMPSFSLDGRALLEAPDRIAANPDGHGGSLRALHASGALADMRRRGVDQISYFQVDNPLVRCIDPLFIGLHAMERAEMSSKIVAKASPTEKVGNFVLADGRISVIEYSDLPDDLARQTDAEGAPRFNAGSIAIHVLDLDFVERLNEGTFGLPYHRAVKKVAHTDADTGEAVTPDQQPNAVKLETFVFDALPLCERSVVLETLREEEFAPIKNAEGGDSPDSSRRLQSNQAARWLESTGVRIPWREDGDADCVIELSPLTAIEPDDLRQADHLPATIEPRARITL